LDFIQTGNTIAASAVTRIYVNSAAGFTPFATGIPDIFEGRSDWGDYDNDGDQDLLLAGYIGSLITRIYKNTNGQLAADNSVTLTGIDRGSVEWGDYDGDGDLDILLSGQDVSSNSITKIYKNTGGAFSAVSATGITGISFGQAAWVDFDSDGDLDVMISGTTGTSPNTGPSISKLYRNTGSTFAEVFPNTFEGLYYSSIDFGDYDHDGDMDFLLCGFTNSNTAFTGIYQNNGVGFNIVFDGVLPKVSNGKVLWGDTDNDGDLDIFISGNIITGNEKIAQVYINTGTGFQPGQSFTEAGQSAAEFADYDGDGNLDLFVAGQKNDLSLYSAIYKNGNTNSTPAGNANTRPSAPTNLTFKMENNKVVLGWDKSTDDKTPQPALTYNIYLRNTSAAIVNAYSLNTGKRKVVKRGNAGHANSLALSVPAGDYVWSVQAIDNSYAGSAFSAEMTIHVPVVVGIADKPVAEGFSVYPNPVRDQLNIRANDRVNPFQLQLYAPNGSQISCFAREIGDDVHAIDFSQFGPGEYMLHLRSGDSTSAMKIVKE
jgi:hypothetical protein